MAPQKLSMRSRILLDTVLTLFFIVALGARFTGELGHELIGLGVFGLLAFHLSTGRIWVKRLFSGTFTAKRWLAVFVNMLLLITALVVLASGVILFLKMNEGMGARQVHTIAAYWMLVLTGVHVGLYWGRVAGVVSNLGKVMVRRRMWECRAVYLSRAGTLFIMYGVWASFERSMGAKLFLGFSFDFWDPNWPAIIFFLNYLAVMGCYIGATWFFMKFAGKALPLLKHQLMPVMCVAKNRWLHSSGKAENCSKE